MGRWARTVQIGLLVQLVYISETIGVFLPSFTEGKKKNKYMFEGQEFHPKEDFLESYLVTGLPKDGNSNLHPRVRTVPQDQAD